MTELLAPAGSMEALKAAVSNGANAIYLGMQKFGARAYSSNFDEESLREAVKYAHLRDVKIYVTMNTIVFEDEISDMKEQLHLLNQIGVDGVIVQDLAVFNYIKQNFTNMEAHCSTQMGIDDKEGTLLFKELGADRVVLARETPIEKVKEIKKETQMPLEIFVHGALCVSYSGNCLMSGLIGYRSGNRGRCVGSCRKPYELIDKTTGKSIGKSYILSTKDLNTIDYIDQLKDIDSLKIEGRMKEPTYVANVVSKYRAALDGKLEKGEKEDLKKTFNRTFTKGYLFHEDPKNIANTMKPNNFGYEIGKITGTYKGTYEIKLNSILNQNDIIRIDHNKEDINLSVAKLYDKNGNLINKATDTCYIKIKEKLTKGDTVYKTKDYLYYKDLEKILEKDFKKYPIDFKVYAYPGSHLIVHGEAIGYEHLYESQEIIEEAKNNPTTKEQITKQLSRLGDTIFTLKDIEFDEYNGFIPSKLLNTARREIVDSICEQKSTSKPKNTTKNSTIKKDSQVTFPPVKPYLTATVTTKEQYEICKELGIKHIYFDNIIRRNQNNYQKKQGELLIGGYGGIYYYKDTNPFVTDYSLNVVNAESCKTLHSLGAKRITLSYELNKNNIKQLLDTYYNENGGYPSLEMIVYGRAPLMFTKYCPLKTMNQCGICKTKTYEIQDEYGNFPIISHEDCSTTILNGKILNLLDEMPTIQGIEAFRLNFTIEDKKQVENIVKIAIKKLEVNEQKSAFNQETDTRGHYNKEIM